MAIRLGRFAAGLSRRYGIGSGGMIGGRVALAMAPSILDTLARDRSVLLVTGTNGKTTTSHLLAAALRNGSSVAHNATGANMTDGAVAALMADLTATTAVLEVDELHLPVVAASTRPIVICLLNLTRDQLDRGTEVRRIAAVVRRSLAELPSTTVVADADDPLVVWVASAAARTIWVATGSTWTRDARSCPRCGEVIRWVRRSAEMDWRCDCGLHRPRADWDVAPDSVTDARGTYDLELVLPGRANRANAAMAIAAASVLHVEPSHAAAAMRALVEIDGRYSQIRHGHHHLRLLLAKNPAGWVEVLDLLADSRAAVLLVVNAAEADGRDVSWLWDVDFATVRGKAVACSGTRSPDLGLRLSYADVDHSTAYDPLDALAALPPGPVDVAANYTAFHQIRNRLARSPKTPE